MNFHNEPNVFRDIFLQNVSKITEIRIGGIKNHEFYSNFKSFMPQKGNGSVGEWMGCTYEQWKGLAIGKSKG